MKKVVLVLAIFVLFAIMAVPCFGEMCPMTNVSIFSNKYTDMYPNGTLVDGPVVGIIVLTNTGADTVCGPEASPDVYDNYLNLFFGSRTFLKIKDRVKEHGTAVIFIDGDPDQEFDRLVRHEVDDVVCPSVIGEKIIQAKGYKDLKSTVIGQIPMYRIVVPNEDYNIRNTFK